jgi:hypothetical protein
MADDDINMDTFAPEFAQFWLADQRAGGEPPLAGVGSDESPSPSQREALEALTERVNAARSTV